ncbi:MAG: hypothetical protein AABZ55_08200 [Bdellovibrionota bacterium]
MLKKPFEGSILFKNETYRLQFKPIGKTSDTGIRVWDNVEFIITADHVTQSINLGSFNKDNCLGETPIIKWAGDFDGDQKLDLILQIDSTKPIVFFLLSSAAKKGDHLKIIYRLDYPASDRPC